MQQIGHYLLQLTAAAFLCSIAMSFFGKKSTFGAVIHLLAGVFLTLSILSPWVRLRLDELDDLTSGISASADAVGKAGQNAAREAMAESIRRNTCAYILDKAGSLDAQLTVEVYLDDSDIPIPYRVQISGNVSPYAKRVLSSLIAQDLGIGVEEQIWI